tara:strand:- start:959 stop:1204 length:246 start_codon:yes stop_codon:yes gene_type:complete
MSNIMNEFIKNYINPDKKKQQYKRAPYKDQDSVRADKFIKHCQSCNKCWEYNRKHYGGQIHVYENFPTYGKEKEMCPICSN